MVRRRIAGHFNEGKAVARQAGLIARHGRRQEPPLAGRRAVVMVHGYMAGAPVFDPLRKRIATELGWSSLAFNYPSYGDFEATAERFRKMIDGHVPESTELVLLGHSLGGILARWYVQELGGASRVSRIVTVSTPHRGTDAARMAPFGLGAAIRRDSAIVDRLGLGGGDPPIHAIAGGTDRTVTVESALGCNAEQQEVVDGVGHNAILYAPHAQSTILAAVSKDGEVTASQSSTGA